MRAFTAEVMGMKNPMLIALAVLALVVMPANTQAQKIHTEITADTTTGNRVANTHSGRWRVEHFNCADESGNHCCDVHPAVLW